LRQLGEGQKITVVGWALAARAGNPESCNCYLRAKEDKDNHIVLVDPSLRRPTLSNNEDDSVTVEFTPRVRLRHANFTQEKPIRTACCGRPFACSNPPAALRCRTW
jgi:hypothetical protein